jgi:hypothetical protein
MADEAAIIELLGNKGDPVRYTVADGNAVAKGTLMYLSGDRTISAHSGQGQDFVGIAATEKVADDGQVTLAVYTNGIFDLTDSGSGITLGDAVKLGATANEIATADDNTAQQMPEIVGIALETASANEVIAVRVIK